MEHPIFFITKLLEAIGLGHFAHAYPQVTYTWLIMLLLIVVSLLAVKSVKMVPAGGQNLFEMVISGIENFQVDTMGEHGRSVFPLIATLFIFIFVSNVIGLIPGFLFAHGQYQHHLGCALIVFFTTEIIGIKTHGFKYIKQYLGPSLVVGPADVSH